MKSAASERLTATTAVGQFQPVATRGRSATALLC